MFGIIFILAIGLVYQYQIKKKRPELKDKINFIISTPIISMLLSINIVVDIRSLDIFSYRTASFIDENVMGILGCGTMCVLGFFLSFGWINLLYRSFIKNKCYEVAVKIFSYGSLISIAIGAICFGNLFPKIVDFVGQANLDNTEIRCFENPIISTIIIIVLGILVFRSNSSYSALCKTKEDK